MKTLIAICLTATLMGCAANYPLEESNPQQSTFQVGTSSEITYRTILGLSKDKCYKFIAEAQYYPEAKEGDITLVTLLNSGKIKMTWIRFDIKPMGAGSMVTITYRKGMQEFKDAGLSWAKGEAAACPI